VYSTVYGTVYSYFSGTVYKPRTLQKCYYQSIASLVLYIDQKWMWSKGEASKKWKVNMWGSSS
jgi:hypothetical protein